MNLKTKKFLSVPLCTLSQDVGYEKLTKLILHYGIVEFSRKDTWRNENIIEKSEEELTEEEWAYWASKRVFFYEGASASLLLRNHLNVEKHIANFEEQYGKDAYFSIGMDLLFDAKKGKFPEIQFRIYAAIRSKLGTKKKLARITIKTIQHLLMGYKTQEAFQDSGITNHYSNRQIRYSIDKLEASGLLVYFTNKNRFTYYSTRLNLPDLVREIAKVVAKKKRNKFDTAKIFNEELSKALNNL